MKYGLGDGIPPCPPCRAPQGARGLKFLLLPNTNMVSPAVAPRKGRVG